MTIAIHIIAGVVISGLAVAVLVLRGKIREYRDSRVPEARQEGREEMSEKVLDKVVKKNREALRRLAAERDQLDLLLDVGAITKAQRKERRRAHEKEVEALTEEVRQASRDHERRVGFRMGYVDHRRWL